MLQGRSAPETPEQWVLHGYWRSSCSYRVRIALHWKNIQVAQRAVNLLAGEQADPAYRTINPSGFVPALAIGEGRILTESLAICEYLEEVVPAPALLPTDAFRRSVARAIAHTVASRIQPFQNLSVLRRLPEAERAAHARAAIEPGLAVIEALIAREIPADEGPFAVGEQPSLADVCLVPQLYAARRFGVDLDAYPRIVAADAAATALPAFAAAHPDRQPDAVVAR